MNPNAVTKSLLAEAFLLQSIMEIFTLYILHSKKLDRFYIGFTSQTPEERLLKHLSAKKGFTATAKDWRIVYTETFLDKRLATKREREIKKWKSSLKIKELIERSSTE